jgi:hypothetical protein
MHCTGFLGGAYRAFLELGGLWLWASEICVGRVARISMKQAGVT